MSLEVDIRVPERGVDAGFSVGSGCSLALLGPNGSGKSTILEVLAGLLRTTTGSVVLDGRVLMDGTSWLPTHHRRVAFVSQDTTLFPGMSALDNVAFGVRASGTSKAQARAEASHWLATVGAEHLASRRPRDLSGGEARRIALARALAVKPAMVLLDEPFAGLDLESATLIRALVARVMGATTMVLSTHDAVDAHVLSTSVAILDGGEVAEHGDTATVLTQPRTRFAARMAGKALLVGKVIPTGLALEAGGTVRALTTGLRRGQRGAVAVHPRDIEVTEDPSPGAGSARTHVSDVVVAIEPHGDLVRVHGTTLAADAEPLSTLSLRPGDPIRFKLRVTPVAYGL